MPPPIAHPDGAPTPAPSTDIWRSFWFWAGVIVLARIAGLTRLARVEVDVTSYPPGAAIYVGNRKDGVKGRTPFQLRLPLGKQRITLVLAGFSSREVILVAIILIPFKEVFKSA